MTWCGLLSRAMDVLHQHVPEKELAEGLQPKLWRTSNLVPRRCSSIEAFRLAKPRAHRLEQSAPVIFLHRQIPALLHEGDLYLEQFRGYLVVIKSHHFRRLTPRLSRGAP